MNKTYIKTPGIYKCKIDDAYIQGIPDRDDAVNLTLIIRDAKRDILYWTAEISDRMCPSGPYVGMTCGQATLITLIDAVGWTHGNNYDRHNLRDLVYNDVIAHVGYRPGDWRLTAIEISSEIARQKKIDDDIDAILGVI